MLQSDKAVFVLVDVQGRLAEVMHDREALFANLEKAVRGMQALRIPIVCLEQNPQRMGRTITRLATLLAPAEPIAKMSFSCCGEPAFMDALKATGRKQVLLAGIETHVCVYQTAADLLAAGYQVEVMTDAVSSRVLANKEAGIAKIRLCGGGITTVEMALFELLRSAEHPDFKAVLRIVK
jgi:nicotinamidase-related amidase